MQRPLLLVFDGHNSCVNYYLVKKAQEEKEVTLLKLPFDTTDCLQPLDVYCSRRLNFEGCMGEAAHQMDN